MFCSNDSGTLTEYKDSSLKIQPHTKKLLSSIIEAELIEENDFKNTSNITQYINVLVHDLI